MKRTIKRFGGEFWWGIGFSVACGMLALIYWPKDAGMAWLCAAGFVVCGLWSLIWAVAWEENEKESEK